MAKPFFELIKDQLPEVAEEIFVEKPAPKFQFERVPDEEFEEELLEVQIKPVLETPPTKTQCLTEHIGINYIKEIYFNLYDKYRMLPEVPVGLSRFEKEDNPLVFSKKRTLGKILDNLTCLIAQTQLEEELLLYKTKLERIKNAIE